MFCFSKCSVRIRESHIKPALSCGLCGNTKNIITLVCNHKCCVKCYNKIKYCIQCEKVNSKSWCC